MNRYLLDHNADRDIENGDGNKAIVGIDGDHIGKWEWGSPMNQFKAITDLETMNSAFTALEECADDMLDKLALAQTGLKLKKSVEGWDADRFQTIVSRAPAPE